MNGFLDGGEWSRLAVLLPQFSMGKHLGLILGWTGEIGDEWEGILEDGIR